MLHVEINGETQDFADGMLVKAMLEVLELSGDGIAVEINREIIPRRAHAETALKDGDKIEIVTFVGGG